MGIVFLVLFWYLVHEPAALEKLLFSFGDSLTGIRYACLKVQLRHTLVMGHSKAPIVMALSFRRVPLRDPRILGWLGRCNHRASDQMVTSKH